MEKWVRGVVIGRGSFGTVNLAFGLRKSNPQTPLLMAVKSAPLPLSSSLQKELQVLQELKDCPQILRCFGHDIAADVCGGQVLYNVFLEYASGGSLAHLGKLPESRARRYTASIVQGLSYIHQSGFVHCDVKLRNILLCSEEIKIADFGLAKKAGEKAGDGVSLRGTPLYMAPESVARSEYEPASDVWALGCAVLEMVTGKPAWSDAADVRALLFRIARGDELPEIPPDLSEECRDFLSRCFVRDPSKRWTAEMLLQHPFISKGGDETVSEASISRPSPRSVFDLMAWDLPQPSSLLDSFVECEGEFNNPIGFSSPPDRIAQLATATKKCPDWSDSEGDWITIRKTKSSFSHSPPAEIQDLGCSVSSARDSLLVLEEMVLNERNGEENSNSNLDAEFPVSTGSAVNGDNSRCGFNGYDCNASFWRGRGEFGCSREKICIKKRRITRRREKDQFEKTSVHGSGFFPFNSSENWDCNCNYSLTSDEYEHKNIY